MSDYEKTINTEGGAASNDVHVGKDFIGRDQTIININVKDWNEIGDLFLKALNESIQQKIEEKERIIGKKHGSQEEQLERTKKIDATINQLFQTHTQFATINWNSTEQVYLAKVKVLYNRLRILGSSNEVQLGNIFTQIYILDRLTAHRRHDIEELRRIGKDWFDIDQKSSQRIHGMALVKQNKNLFILGKPGAGKTTFLKYITIQAADKWLPRIPIFVSLNLWADSKWGRGDDAALLPFIVEQFDICGFPDAELFIEYLLQQGRALLLFDGLDEVKQEQDQRRRLTRLLQNFADKYNKSQHLITCRIAASEYAFAGFDDVEVADFTPEQVAEYANKWFGENQKKAEAFGDELAKAENKGLAELCNSPLLLSLLCLTFDNNMRFPPSRAELYEDALETLLRKWDTNRQIQRDEIYRELSYKRKLQLLMSIAVPTFERGEIFFRQRDLEKRIVDYLVRMPGAPSADSIDGIAILKAIEAQHSVLVERAQGIYSFSHLTFQEYFIARYLAENQNRVTIRKLIHEHLNDRRWREVFLLTASLLDGANDFIKQMQRSIDNATIKSPTLFAIVQWADAKTDHAMHKSNDGCYSSFRLAYLSLSRSFALSSSRSLAFTLSCDLDHALAINLSLELTLAIKRVLDRSLTLALGRLLDLDLALDLTRTVEIARVTSFDVGIDYGFYYLWTYASLFGNEWWQRMNLEVQKGMNQFQDLLQGVAKLAQDVDAVDLANRLRQLPTLMPTARPKAWQELADKIFELLQQRDIARDWNLSKEEYDKLNDYLAANELLAQCVKLAVVSDRQAILDNLLAPPKQAEH